MPLKTENIKYATTLDDGDRRILDLPGGLSTVPMVAVGALDMSIIAPRSI